MHTKLHQLPPLYISMSWQPLHTFGRNLKFILRNYQQRQILLSWQPPVLLISVASVINSIILQHLYFTQLIFKKNHLRKLVDSVCSYHWKKNVTTTIMPDNSSDFFRGKSSCKLNLIFLIIIWVIICWSNKIFNFLWMFLYFFSISLFSSVGTSFRYLFPLFYSIYPFVLLIIRYKDFTLSCVT